MDLLNRETQFKNIYCKVYRKVREANHRSISYRNKYKLAKPLRVGQKVLLENHDIPFGKFQKLFELRSGPYVVTKVITKVNYEIALDADPTRTQVIHRNHLVGPLPRDNELPNLLSNYEKPFNDDKTEHFYNEYAKCRLSQLNQPVDSFVERQYLNDYLPIFPDTCGPSRMDTTTTSPVKENSCQSTPNPLASSPDSGIPQSSPHTPLSFQLESPVITSQPTTATRLPLTLLVLILLTFRQLVLALVHARETQELYGIFLAIGTESHTSKFSLIFYYLFLHFITKTSKETRQVFPNKSYAIQRICIFYNIIYSNTISGASVERQHLVFSFF